MDAGVRALANGARGRRTKAMLAASPRDERNKQEFISPYHVFEHADAGNERPRAARHFGVDEQHAQRRKSEWSKRGCHRNAGPAVHAAGSEALHLLVQGCKFAGCIRHCTAWRGLSGHGKEEDKKRTTRGGQ